MIFFLFMSEELLEVGFQLGHSEANFNSLNENLEKERDM